MSFDIKLAKKGKTPFAASVIKNGKIIASSVNATRKLKDPTAHAEMLAIKIACKKLKT